jgi:hypothetical protein
MNTRILKKSMIRAKRVAITLALLSLSVTPGYVLAATPAGSTGNPVTDQLVSIAQSKLNAEYDVLISGDATNLTKPSFKVNGAAVQGVTDAATVQLRRNKGLAEHGMHYTKSSSKLSVQNVSISNGVETVTALENVTLTLAETGSTDVTETKEQKTHIFRFTQQGGVWSLTDDQTPNEFLPITPEPGIVKIDGKQVPLDVNKKNPKSTQSAIPVSGPIMAAALSGTFNPNNAVNYARGYWSNYNSAYRTFASDCTNFVSQALNWAGWQHIGGPYDDPHNWWYSNNIILQWGGRAEARSWINTNSFYWFARYSGRAHDAAYLSDFRPGDVLQIDKGTPDGILDHTEIVTKKDSSGNIFLTSHSINVLDKPFWDIYYQYPGAYFYGTLMNYSY